MVDYIILGLDRSGNTHIHLAIAGHPMVSAFVDEVTPSPFYTAGISVFTKGGETADEKQRGGMALFHALTSLSCRQGIRARGIHTVLTSPEEAEQVVTAIQKNYPTVRIILIHRLNIISRLASGFLAQRRQVWTSWSESSITEQIALDDDLMVSFMRSAVEAVGIMERLHSSHQVLSCTYENNIMKDNLAFLETAFRFLDLPAVEVSWALTRKIAPAPHLYIKDYVKKLALAVRTIDLIDSSSKYKKAVKEYLENEYRSLSK